MNEYEGNWISTYAGKIFHFLDPQPDEICIEDIAHALANTCRFSGHCSRYYSVAEHSVRLATMVDDASMLAALLHDAHEAYTTDIPRPIKIFLPEIRAMAMTIQEAINSKYGIAEANWKLIRELDNRLLLTEAIELNVHNDQWADLGEVVHVDGKLGWSPEDAKRRFMKHYLLYQVRGTDD